MRLRTAFKTHGGKAPLIGWITSHLPANFSSMTFVDGYGGGGSVTLLKPPSANEVYNELCPERFNAMRVLRDYPDKLIALLKCVPYSGMEFGCWKSWIPHHDDWLGRAAKEIILSRFSRGGLGKDFAWSERMRGGRPGDENSWLTFIPSISAISRRLTLVSLHNRPAVELIRELDSPNTLFYLDPPYLGTTRTAKKCYRFEMDEKQHLELLGVVKQLRGKVMLAGYDNPLYRKHLTSNGWTVVQKLVSNHSSQEKVKQKRIETMWLNYKPTGV